MNTINKLAGITVLYAGIQERITLPLSCRVVNNITNITTCITTTLCITVNKYGTSTFEHENYFLLYENKCI